MLYIYIYVYMLNIYIYIYIYIYASSFETCYCVHDNEVCTITCPL